MKIMLVFGTRPEAIKLSPVIDELGKRGLDYRVVITAQHRQMIDQALGVFGIKPDVDLDIMRDNQTIREIIERSTVGIQPVFDNEKPDIVVVQGDTTSAMAIAMAARFNNITVAHIEAGLRTYDTNRPYPEEINRQVVGRMADLHFAPTKKAANNLLNEGVKPETVFVTGNTIVDALLEVAKNTESPSLKSLRNLDPEKRRIILVTAHRRESFGEPMEYISQAVADLAAQNPEIDIVFPVHLNPKVVATVRKVCSSLDNILLVEPLDYPDLVWLLKQCYLVLTDSGGLQEEAPTFKKPVLVMREKTERPEGLAAGAAKLVGVNRENIAQEAQILIDNEKAYAGMQAIVNPYGDGCAAGRIAAILSSYDVS
jgi:UDP-N-acetylglucosamine 2-epimerase (non-hydrolysing)